MSDSALTMFIPFGAGYGNPGLTIRADSADELKAIFLELSEQSDPESASKLDEILDGVATVNAGVLLKGLGSKPEPVKTGPVVTHPQAQANPSDAPSCAHGPMKHREGITKSGTNAGKQYKGWFCSAPYGQSQCKPQFIN
jgi:hypothetical protein